MPSFHLLLKKDRDDTNVTYQPLSLLKDQENLKSVEQMYWHINES